jgi:hypothetical protein
VLIVGGLMVLMRMISVGIFADSNVEYRMIALNLANEKLEEIKDASFSSITSSSETGSSLGFDFVDNRIVTVTDVESDLKDVTVQVQWTQKASQESVEVETYIADY